jgi:hypothetical protein
MAGEGSFFQAEKYQSVKKWKLRAEKTPFQKRSLPTHKILPPLCFQ